MMLGLLGSLAEVDITGKGLAYFLRTDGRLED